jgi:replication factor A1
MGKPIGEITNQDRFVDLICRVKTLNSKEFTRNGRKSNRYFGMLEDATGNISFSAWEELPFIQGDIIKIERAGVREWQGILQVNFGKSTKILKTTDKEIIKKFKDLNTHEVVHSYFINSLEPGLENVSCICRIVSVEPIEIKTNEEIKTVYKGIVADETGSIRFTAWHDLNMEKNMTVEIQGASVRLWQGFLELNLNRKTNINKNINKTLPETTDLPVEKSIKISDIWDCEYLSTPEFVLEGTIIELKDGSGLIKRCPHCSRVIKENECIIHGKIELISDLRLKVVVDDGYGAITIIVGKELSEQLTGKTLEEYLTVNSSNKNSSSVFKDLFEFLILKNVRVKGNTLKDDFGVSLYATSISLIEIDTDTIRATAQQIIEEI